MQMLYLTCELEQHQALRDQGKDPRTLFWRYHKKEDVVDIIIEGMEYNRVNGDSLMKRETGMRLVKHHCSQCKLIFGYDPPSVCPGGQATESMIPGKPGILYSGVKRSLGVSKSSNP
jgi:hypothetical protein